MSVERLDVEEHWQELEQLYGQARELLAGLDRLGLYQAGAYLSMAMDAMRRRHPDLTSSD